MQWKRCLLTLVAGISLNITAFASPSHPGYYRQPALHGDQLIFVSEGDLWTVKTNQTMAHRLTSRRGAESNAVISPDGTQVAFVANYEGAYEAYVIPVSGGIPKRITFEQKRTRIQQWTKSGEVLYSTDNSVGPAGSWRLKLVNPSTLETREIPLSDANQGIIDETGKVVYFTRFGTHISGDHLRQYRGGGQGQIWRYQMGSQKEAQLLTPTGSGSNSDPMYYQGKVYFLSDQSGNPNLWSMNPDGSEKKQLTTYTKWPVKTPELNDGNIIFQLGADLVIYDILNQQTRTLPVQLVSDQPFRQPYWIKNPLEFETSTTLTPDGKRVVITARGKVVVATADGIRLTEIQTPPHSRVKLARMSQDQKWIYAICDASGEEQIWRFAADGSDNMKQLTHDGQSVRWSLSESPDGKFLLTDDKDGQLWSVEVSSGKMKKLLGNGPVNEAFGTYRWSDNSRYLAISTMPDDAERSRVILYDLQTDRHQQLTTDKYNSFSPDFSPDGQWLYFLSDRRFKATPASPWLDRTPDPVFTRRTGVFAVALNKDADFPFQPLNELIDESGAVKYKKQDPKKQEPEEKQKEKSVETDDESKAKEPSVKDVRLNEGQPAVVAVKKTVSKQADTPKPAVDQKKEEKATSEEGADSESVDWEGIAQRLWQVPVSEGNYSHLRVGKYGLYLLREKESGYHQLKSVRYSHRDVSLRTVAGSISRYALSNDREHLFIIYDDEGYIIPAGSSLPGDLDEHHINTNQWRMQINPVDEWLQMFHSAWLMHRDMFYDPSMRGLDWNAVKSQIEPLVARVSDRIELNDLLGQMTGLLNALHSQVFSGRSLPNNVNTARASNLGAVLQQTSEGVVIKHIYQTDPEVPAMASPLAKPGVDARNGDLIQEINRHSVKSLADVSRLLRNQEKQQVLLTLSRNGEVHQAVVYPVDAWDNRTFAYRDWAEQNRQKVAAQSQHKIGYIYLNGMVRKDFDTFAREFYANTDKQGLIIDVRNNQGGNVDSWIIDKLIRRAWMFWQARHGSSYTNMQGAFRGHIAVIANQMTYSDGETFTAGIKALNLGAVIGMRTFGAGVWLSNSNRLSDRGIARVAQYPQFSMDGQWLVEQHGVKPTVEVDNLPYATFMGQDAQLERAIDYLSDKMKTAPVRPLVPAEPAGASVEGSDVIPLTK